MKALLLGACLAAVLGAPSLAQPYDDRDQGGSYQDQRDPYYDQDQSRDQGYQNDRSYDDNDRYQDDRHYGDDSRNYDRDDRAYDHDRAYDRGYGYGYDQRRGLPPGARFTGRTGSSWRNAEGQLCTWREVTWSAGDGNAAYRWISRCRG